MQDFAPFYPDPGRKTTKGNKDCLRNFCEVINCVKIFGCKYFMQFGVNCINMTLILVFSAIRFLHRLLHLISTHTG